MKYGKLTVIERRPSVFQGNRWRTVDLCECECGTRIEKLRQHLRAGKNLSCGCLKSELARKRLTKHGKSRTPEYHIWRELRHRCTNPAHSNYQDYGGRGITVCDRWESFENFLADMGERPASKHSIDRINNDGNYEPSNCRWATALEQAANTRWCKKYIYNDAQYTIRQLATLWGVKYGCLYHLLVTKKMTMQQAMQKLQ